MLPAYLDADASRRTTKPRQEWYVEQPWIPDPEDIWLEIGIGVLGDSGAPVIGSDTNSLYGQI